MPLSLVATYDAPKTESLMVFMFMVIIGFTWMLFLMVKNLVSIFIHKHNGAGSENMVTLGQAGTILVVSIVTSVSTHPGVLGWHQLSGFRFLLEQVLAVVKPGLVVEKKPFVHSQVGVLSPITSTISRASKLPYPS